MKKFLLLLIFSSFLFSCEEHEFEPVTQEAVQFVNQKNDFPVFENVPTTTSEIDIAVTNLSSQDRVFNVSVNPEKTTALSTQYNLETTQVVVPANSKFGKVILSSSYNSLPDTDVFVDLVLSGSALVSPKESTLVKIFKGCSQNQVNVNFNFDGYASEITWELFDSNNVSLGSGGGYSDGLASAIENFCLAAGNYTLLVNDSYGDGLSFPANGTISVTLGNAVLATGGGNFGSQLILPFTVN